MTNENKKIKVAFPHMGTIFVAWEKALNAIGVEAFIPPYTSKKTLSLGTKNSPEAICLPYKLILGNFIEAIENGADYVSMITSPGICRLGEYGRSIEQVLKELGYNANYIELSLYDGFKGMIDYLSRLTGSKNYLKMLYAILLAVKTVFAVDELQNFLSYHRAREIHKGDIEKAFNKAIKEIRKASNFKELNKALKNGLKEISNVQIDKNRDIIRVDLTGENYIVNEEI